MHKFEPEWNAAWDASFADHYQKGTTAKRAEVWADAFGRSIELGRSERAAFDHALYEVLLISDVPDKHLRYVRGLIEQDEEEWAVHPDPEIVKLFEPMWELFKT